MNNATTRLVSGPAGKLAAHVMGKEGAPAVLMSHSILAASMMWERQAALLAKAGFYVVAIDTRGHGESAAAPAPYTMDQLADDTIAVMDGLGIDKAHYIGLSLGGMVGFGLGINHGERLLSMVLCDARADAPAPFAALWDERIAAAKDSCASLAESTALRWFGAAFLAANPEIGERFRDTIANTSSAGFIGCARAIQGLNYLGDVEKIRTPVTLVVGANDQPLPDAMAHLQTRIPDAKLEVIPGAGHLPNIDQPDAFDAALLRHFAKFAPR
jgi:3-oxoadipate enol-lactonase